MDENMSEVPPPRANYSNAASTAHRFRKIEVNDAVSDSLLAKLRQDDDALSAIRASEKEKYSPPAVSEFSLRKLIDNETDGASDVVLEALRNFERNITRRIDDIESLLSTHMATEKTNSASVCHKLETHMKSIESSNAMVDTLSQIMKDTEKSILAIELALIKREFEAVPPPPSKPSSTVASLGGGAAAAAGSDEPAQTGGFAIVPSHESPRIMPEEFENVRAGGHLRHVWMCLPMSDESHKVRLSSLTIEDVHSLYHQGGAIYPNAKTAYNWALFVEERVKFTNKKYYTHCREKK